MNDANCIICTPSLCVHGEQSPAAEELKQASLEEQLAAMTKERDNFAGWFSLASQELDAVTQQRDELQLNFDKVSRSLSTLQAATLRAWRQSRPPPRPKAAT